MLVQKKISVGGEWAKAMVDLVTGDLITINDSGQVVPGEYGERNVFKVETKNGEKNLSFNQTTMNYLIDALGNETAKWAGKQVKVWLVKSNVSGKMRNVVYLTAPDWVEGEDGFYPPAVKKTQIDDGEIPIINDEINTKDIPF